MLKTNKRTKLAVVIAAITMASSTAVVQAAGFQLKEQSAEGQGNSFAGQTAKAVDASTIFFNPAGMTRIKGNHVQSNLSIIRPSADYSHKSNSSAGGGAILNKTTGIDGGNSAFVPAAYALWDYSDDIKLGISINAPFGLSTEYDEDWIGAQYNVFSEIKTINFAPSIAYRVNDQLSIGGNIQFQKIEGKLSNINFVPGAVLSTLTADDTGLGYSFGFLYEYSDTGRVGFNYRSKIKHTLKGGLSTPDSASPALNFDAHADLTLPAVVSVGLYQEVSDKWTLLADVAWTDWSELDELNVIRDSDGSTRSTTIYNWDDTIFAAIGANYQFNEKLQLKFGIAYDEGAANDEDRTAGIPDATRYWASIGASYKINDKATLNAGYSHIKAKKAKISENHKLGNLGGGTEFSGEFDSNIDILSIGFDYKF